MSDNLYVQKAKMTETNLECVQRLVSGYDTKAGQKLRYIITRAQADEVFSDNMHFNTRFNTERRIWLSLSGLFTFNNSLEGHDYWWRIHTQTMKYVHKDLLE